MATVAQLTTPSIDPPQVMHAERLTALLADQLGMGFWRLAPHGGKVFWSARVFEIYGIPAQDEPLALETAIGMIVPEDRAMAGAMLQLAMREKHARKVVFRIDTDSGIKLVEYTADVVISHGEVVELFGTVLDITGRSMKDANAVGRSLLVRAMMKNVPAAIAVFDTHMNYLAVSDYWIAGHQTAHDIDLIGKNHYAVRSEITGENKVEHQRVLAGETLRRPRAYMRDRHGKPVEQTCVMCPWHRVDGSIGGIMMMLGSPDEPDLAPPPASNHRPTRQELLDILKDLH